MVLIDAGSGVLLLAEIIDNEKTATSRLLRLYPDSWQPEQYLDLEQTFPFQDLAGSAFSHLRRILRCTPTVLITHPHLDHILALVLNLAGLDGPENDPNTQVYASSFTADALRKHVFNGIVWPDLVLLNVFGLHTVEPEKSFSVNDGIYSVTMMDLCHGHIAGSPDAGHYVSLAFLLCHNASQAKILVFGDFEADSVLDTGLNRRVWLRMAPYIADGTLKAVVLECSSCTVAAGTNLYGHLMPSHLICEFETLRSLCTTSLEGLHVVVTHVKEDPTQPDPRRKVLTELRELNEKAELGLRFTMALSGLSLKI